jgi:hypothetical protein
MKKTEFFDGAKFVPAHVGVYEVEHGYFQYFNGQWWGAAVPSIIFAKQVRQVYSTFQSPTWRGIEK